MYALNTYWLILAKQFIDQMIFMINLNLQVNSCNLPSKPSFFLAICESVGVSELSMEPGSTPFESMRSLKGVHLGAELKSTLDAELWVDPATEHTELVSRLVVSKNALIPGVLTIFDVELESSDKRSTFFILLKS